MRLNKTLKQLAIFLAFSLSYICSAFLAVPITGESIDKIADALPSFAIGVMMILALLIMTRINITSFRHVGLLDFIRIFAVCLAVLAMNLVLSLCQVGYGVGWCVVVFLLHFVSSAFLLASKRILKFVMAALARLKYENEKRVLIVGAGEAGGIILREIQNTDKINYKVVGVLDDDVRKTGRFVSGVKVLGTCDDVERVAKDRGANLIIIAIPSASAAKVKRISNLCLKTGCEVKVLPGLYQLIDGEVSVSHLRGVDVRDLLGREPVRTDIDEIIGYIENKVVMVTGGGGSIGSELCRQIARHSPKLLIILDIYENNAYDIEQELKRNCPETRILTLIASIRDSVKMDKVFAEYRPNIVFHAAAHKHVPLMEMSPNEAVKNNIIGTYNVVKCADKYGVEKFVQISTDKAVNPTNIMGATKRVCEMIIQAFSRRSKTSFVAVRFGNVLGSNGSVIPLFRRQIAEGGPVTVTHKDIIRYFMTIPEAVSLVLQAGAYAKGGEIFVLDMGEQVRIYDLAENLIRLMGYVPGRDIEIKITGLRPGEKLYEERLMAEEGLTRTANDRISIGKPIVFDDESFFKTLDELYEKAYEESPDIKRLVKELVPTYRVYTADEDN